MKKVILSLIALGFIVNTKAQVSKKKLFQLTPGVNKKSITGKITNLKKSNLEGSILIWVFIGDTVVHVWSKDYNEAMKPGTEYTFNGIQKLVGAQKYLDR